MPATGILRPDEVVFYHPLDSDFTEHTVGEVWSGTASSVAGKVGQGNSAVTSSSIGVGALSTVEAGTSLFENTPVGAAALSGTSVVVTYADNDDNTGRARAGVVSGTTVTWGTAEIFRATMSSNTDFLMQPDVRTLDSTHVIMGYSRAVPLGGYVRVGVVSGMDITFGAELQFSSQNMNGELRLAVMDSTHAITIYREGSVTGQCRATVCTISGTDATFGAETTVSTVAGHSSRVSLAITALSSTVVVAAVIDADMLIVGTRSGSDMTWGPPNTKTFGTNWRPSLEAMSSTTAIFGLWNAASTTTLEVITVSGTDITFGAANSGMSGVISHPVVGRLGSTSFVVVWRASAGSRAAIGTVSGTDITLGAFTAYNSQDSVSQKVAVMSGTKFLMAGSTFSSSPLGDGTAFAAVGTLAASAGISGTSASYPTAIGHDRVVMAMWARNLTAGSSTVTVERGYSVAMTATSIALGGTTATWSGAGIGTLMSTMNDDSDHLLVLDFENTGGTNWTLKTSVDGMAFTSQGAQTAGTQVVATTDTDPSLAITSGFGESQWIDELVVWAGDKTAFESFTTQEMANLNDLADTFGETMDQFEENFGAPLCWQATARMPDGSVWRDSGSGPCPPVVRVPMGADDIIVTDDGATVSPRIQEG